MTDEIKDCTEIISDTEIERVKNALFNGEKMSISTCVFEKIIDRLEFSEQQLKRKENDCEKWKSYYVLYRQDQALLKQIQGVINSHPKYGIELTETGIIDKDERISCLEIDEQIKLIFTEYEAELQAEKGKVKKLEEENNDLIQENASNDVKTYDLVSQIKNLEQKVKELEKEKSILKSWSRHLEQWKDNLLKENGCYKHALEEIKEIATIIIEDDDKPACVYDEDCPLNGGVGFDNHCNLKCPYVLTKQILQKCEVLNDV